MKLIYCAGGLGRTILDSIRRSNRRTEIAFVDDNNSLHGKTIEGTPVIGGLTDVDQNEYELIIGYGADTTTRAKLVEMAKNIGWDFFSFLDSESTVSNSASLGDGVYINAQGYLGPRSELGDHVVVDSCVNISHDVEICKGAIITPGATLAGDVSVEENAYVGPNATVLKERTVGKDAIVGAGAVVTDDVAPGETVVGVPARPIH